ncbi:MAG: nuclear transport factor 2 family protein [Thermoguttaceae bacterium]|jgi:hypothetical protein|nr:nuclear transport factor 2 family protein [Thermoguttaceae bacterium]
MTTLVETPVPVLVLGILAAAAFGWLYMTMRRPGYLLGLGAVLLVVVVGVLVEWLVVTDREQVEATLDAAVAALEANDIDRVESLLSEGGLRRLRPRIRAYSGMVEFDEVRIRNVEVYINDLTAPPSAEVTLDGTAHFRHRFEGFPYNVYSARFRVELVKEPRGWRVEDVYGDPQQPYRPE